MLVIILRAQRNDLGSPDLIISFGRDKELAMGQQEPRHT